MKKFNISSTKLKRDTAEILNLIAYGKATAIIERHGEPLAKIVPLRVKKESSKLKTKLEKYFGSIPNFPFVSKKRHFKKRQFTL